MYNSIQRQYVFRQTSGELWNFFHDEKLGLCYSTLTKRNTWTNPVSFHKNAHHSFFTDMDQEDRFHILFQDNQGTIQYSYLDGNSLKTIPVLNSKTPTVYEKHLFLIPFKNNVHFFYVLQHEGSWILAYQVLNDGKISSPKVVDYVPGSICPYAVVCDKASNLYVFYQSSDGKFLQLGYKKYNTAQKFWSEFTPVTKYAGNCEYPRAIIDANGIIHICYQRSTTKQYEIVYQQKVHDKNLWSGEIVVHSSVHQFDNSSIIWINDDIIVYWVRDDIIYYNIGSQSGNIWGKPSRLDFTAGRQLLCLAYRTNNVYESQRIVADNIPGSFVGGLKLAFYQQPQDNGENLSAEDLKTLILDSLKLLKASIEDLKESELEIREQLTGLENTCRELDKEMVKCTVKANYPETQAGQIKIFSKRLNGFEAELKSIRSEENNTDEQKPPKNDKPDKVE
jgi:hypothetical protein